MDMKADSPMHQRLRRFLKQHDTTVKTKYAAHRSRMFVHGLASVVSALRRTVRCNVIEESFAKCGIYLYCPNIIMANCTAKISIDEATNILCVLPDLAKILFSKGEIGDADFDRFGIRKNENSFKDQFCIPRRRGVIMTNVEVFQKERDLLVAKRMREATKTLGKRSMKAGDKEQANKKRREELNDIPGSEPLLLRIRLPTESVYVLN